MRVALQLTTGTIENDCLGSDSSMMPPLMSQRAPSSWKPNTRAPAVLLRSGKSASQNIFLRTSVWMVVLLSFCWGDDSRQNTCLMAVKKELGLISLFTNTTLGIFTGSSFQVHLVNSGLDVLS